MNTKINKAIVTQKNELTESRCDWTIYMSRAYCRITDLFTQRYNYLKTKGLISNNIVWDRTTLTFDIPRKDLSVIGKDGYEDMPTIYNFKSTFDRLSYVGLIEGRLDDENNWKKINVISGVRYDSKTDSVHVEIGSMMADYLLELNNKYTVFNPWMAMKFQKSKYSFRFYEFCCQWRTKGDFELSIAELKHRFQLNEYIDERGKKHPEKYKKLNDFKEYVIIPAYNELKELFDAGDCDVCFNYKEITKTNLRGKPTVIGFNFTINTKSSEKKKKLIPLQPSLFQDANNRLIEIRQILMYYFSDSIDKNWPERAVNELGKKVVQNSNLLPEIETLINKTINRYKTGKVNSIPATIRSVFKDTYGIDVDLKQSNN